LTSLKTALKWAHAQKLIPAVPRFPAVKVPKKKPQPIPAEAFEKLLDKAPDELWRAFLLCGWWAGLRLSEVSKLQWEQSDKLPWIDWKGNRIVLPAVFAKSDEDQWAPLHPTLRETLEALPRTGLGVFPFRSRKGGGPLSRNGVTNRVLAMAKLAGVKLSMHKLRKGFGCRVAKQLDKGNAPILHALMRHSTMQVTMDYYANVDDALQDAITSLV
jgi:integrase